MTVDFLAWLLAKIIYQTAVANDIFHSDISYFPVSISIVSRRRVPRTAFPVCYRTQTVTEHCHRDDNGTVGIAKKLR